MKSHSDIHLHIEELVLHGFAPGDRHQIAEAVEQELVRLIAQQPLSAQKNISLERIDGGSFQMKSDARPASVGEQIAGAVHGGLEQ